MEEDEYAEGMEYAPSIGDVSDTEDSPRSASGGDGRKPPSHATGFTTAAGYPRVSAAGVNHNRETDAGLSQGMASQHPSTRPQSHSQPPTARGVTFSLRSEEEERAHSRERGRDGYSASGRPHSESAASLFGAHHAPSTTASAAAMTAPQLHTSHTQLILKVRQQANELTDLLLQLNNSKAYTQVLERRLLEICPDHAIPVTEEHLSMPVTSLSRLATTAAAGLIASGSAGSTAASSSLAAKASHVLAATAAHRKEAVDSADSMRRLEKSLNETRAKLTDTQRRLKEGKALVDARDKEKSHLQRRCEAMQQRIVSLEAEMRVGGLQPSAAGALAAYTSDVDILLHPSGSGAAPGLLAASFLGGGSIGAAATTTTSSGGLGLSRLTATATAHNIPVSSTEELVSRVRTLEIECDKAASARDSACEALRAEARAGEEARAYIGILEKALQNRAIESGMSIDTARLLAESAKSQGAMEAMRRDALSKEERLRSLERQLSQAQAQVRALESSTHSGAFGAASNSSGGGGTTTPAKRGGSDRGETSVFSPLLGDINAHSHKTGALQAQLREGEEGGEGAARHTTSTGGSTRYQADTAAFMARLEAEKAALLDYIAEARDVSTATQAQLESLSQQNAILTAEIEGLREQSHSQGTRAADAETKWATTARQVAEAQTAAASAEARVSDWQNRARVAEEELGTKEAEISELREVQNELLDSIREQKQALDECTSQCDQLKQRQEETARRYRSTESTLDHVEHERDMSERRTRELEDAIHELSTRAAELELTGDSLRQTVNSLESLKAENSLRLKTLEQDLATAKAEANSLQQRLDVADRQAKDLLVELGTLRSLKLQLSKSADSISRRLPTLENALPEPTFTAADATTGTTNAADTQVTQLAQRTAASLTSRADEVLAWSNMEALSEASPVVSAAFRSVSGWLRSAGVALGETAQRVAVELGEKRGQRHMLYDEIHALREETAKWKADSETDRAAAQEARLALEKATGERERTSQTLTAANTTLTRERNELQARVATLQVQLQHAAEDIASLSSRNETVTGQLQGASTRLQELTAMQEGREGVLLQATNERDEARRSVARLQDDVANTAAEKKGLLEQVRGLEAHIRELNDRSAAKSTEYGVVAADLATAKAQVTDLATRLDASNAVIETLRQHESSSGKKLHELKKTVRSTAELAEQQNLVITELERENKSSAEERAMLQRSITSTSVDVETAKEQFNTIYGQCSDAIELLRSTLRGVGVELQLEETRSHHAPQAPTHTGRRPTGAGSSSERSSGGGSLMAQVRRVRDAASSLTSAVEAACGQVAASANELADARKEVNGMRTRIHAVDDVAAAAQDRARSLAVAESTIMELRNALGAAQSQHSYSHAELSGLRQRVADQQRELDQSTARIAELVHEMEVQREGERDARAALNIAERRIADLEAWVNRAQRDADTLVSQHARLENVALRDNGKLSEVNAELASATIARQRAESSLADTRASLAKARQELADFKTEFSNLNARLVEAQELLSLRERDLLDTRDQLNQLAMMHAEAEQMHANDAQRREETVSDALATKQAMLEEVHNLRAEVGALRANARAYGSVAAPASMTGQRPVQQAAEMPPAATYSRGVDRGQGSGEYAPLAAASTRPRDVYQQGGYSIARPDATAPTTGFAAVHPPTSAELSSSRFRSSDPSGVAGTTRREGSDAFYSTGAGKARGAQTAGLMVTGGTGTMSAPQRAVAISRTGSIRVQLGGVSGAPTLSEAVAGGSQLATHSSGTRRDLSYTPGVTSSALAGTSAGGGGGGDTLRTSQQGRGDDGMRVTIDREGRIETQPLDASRTSLYSMPGTPSTVDSSMSHSRMRESGGGGPAVPESPSTTALKERLRAVQARFDTLKKGT